MKFIFDNEEQKETFIRGNCPSDYGLRDDECGCDISGTNSCFKCWKRYEDVLTVDAKLKTEDAVKVKRSDKDRYLIDIPPSGDYVEILGHKIYGNWNEGVKGDDKSRESFINFCEYLHRVDELERRLERFKDALTQEHSDGYFKYWADKVYKEGLLTENDIRWLKNEEEIDDTLICKSLLTNHNKEIPRTISEYSIHDIYPKVILDEVTKTYEKLKKKFNHLHALLNDEIYEAFEKHGYSKEWLNDINNINRIEVIESPNLVDGNGNKKIDIFCVEGVELFKVTHFYEFTLHRHTSMCTHGYYITHIYKEKE